MMATTMTASTFVCILLAGCGGQTSWNVPEPGGAAGTAGAGEASDTGAAGTGLVAPDGGVLVVDESDVPIPGAIVVVEHAGVVDEQLTTHRGIATFSDVDFASATVDLTAFSPGRILVTVLGVSPGSSRVLHLRPRGSSAQWTRTLTLRISHKVSSNDCVAVGLTTPSVHVATCGDSPQPDTLVVKTLPGASGKIVAQDLVSGAPPDGCPPAMAAMYVADIPASGDAIDVDFAKAALVEEASGALVIPDLAPGCVVGITTRRTASDLQAFFVEPEQFASNGVCYWKTDYARAFPEAEVETRYDVWINWTSVGVVQRGYFPARPPPPVPDPIWVTSPGGSLFDPITWSAGAESPERLIVWASDAAANTLFPVWSVRFPSAPGRVTLHKPPDDIWSQLDWSDASSMRASLEYCEPESGQGDADPSAPMDERGCARYVRAWAPDPLTP